MKILVITPPQEVLLEVETIHELFRNGLEILHLRKPDYDYSRFEMLLKNIESKYHHRIMVHAHHSLGKEYQLRGIHFPAAVRYKSKKQLHCHQSTSCHSIEELESCCNHFEYLLVSPVFDSISKPGYCAGIHTAELEKSITHSRRRVVGLGGITPETLQKLPENCWGAAVLGYVWGHDTIRNRIRNFEKLIAGA